MHELQAVRIRCAIRLAEPESTCCDAEDRLRSCKRSRIGLHAAHQAVTQLRWTAPVNLLTSNERGSTIPGADRHPASFSPVMTIGYACAVQAVKLQSCTALPLNSGDLIICDGEYPGTVRTGPETSIFYMRMALKTVFTRCYGRHTACSLRLQTNACSCKLSKLEQLLPLCLAV